MALGKHVSHLRSLRDVAHRIGGPLHHPFLDASVLYLWVCVLRPSDQYISDGGRMDAGEKNIMNINWTVWASFIDRDLVYPDAVIANRSGLVNCPEPNRC